VADSKQGTVPSTDPAPGLPVNAGRIFGESPVKRPISGGKHPPARADASEEQNLKDAAAPMAPTR
jgi:hypothetical protein